MEAFSIAAFKWSIAPRIAHRAAKRAPKTLKPQFH